MKKRVVVQLTDREHIIKRCSVYLGANDEAEKEGFYLNNNGNFEYNKHIYVPGLVKIINEIIDNSVDEAIETNFKYANQISVKIDTDKNQITVIDNGRGIPQESTGDIPGPIIAWGMARAGSNFEDDDRVTIGTNGLGSFITNCFSKEFIGVTCDGKNCFSVKFVNNAESYTSNIKPTENFGTMVKFTPDLEKFGVSKIDDVYINIIHQRLYDLAITYPNIKFVFNGKIIKVRNIKEYADMFSDNYDILEFGDKGFVIVCPNETDDFKHYTFINGMYLTSGGNHLDYITNTIVNELKEKLIKRYKTIKPADIKNKLLIISFFRNFPNVKFDSQTKEKLTNSITEIKQYLEGMDLVNFSNKIYKNKSIIEPITEFFKIKEEYKNRKNLEGMTSSRKKIKSDKYFSATKIKKYLVLAEGNSATGGIMPVLGKENFGYYSLRGKPLNVLDAKVEKIVENEEIKDIINILGIKINQKNEHLDYENILIATDADADGIHIRGLLINLFYFFSPEIIKAGKLKILNTPLIVGKKNNKLYKYFMTIDEYNEFIKHDTSKVDWKYMKGLGSWDRTNYKLKEVFDSEGLSNFIDVVEYSNDIKNLINNWMGKSNSDFRKSKIKGKPFNISIV